MWTRTTTALALALALAACGPNVDRLRTHAQPVIDRLEEHRARTGAYPLDLRNAGIELPDDGYGGWTYQPMDDGASYELAIGRYVGDGFELSWRPESGWYHDT